MLVVVIIDSKNPLLITGVTMLMVLGMDIPINIMLPSMLKVMIEVKGKISALYICIRMIFIASTVQIVSYLFDGTILFIGLAMCFSILLTIFLSYQLIKSRYLFEEE
jgi:hypothetical protein